MATTIKGVAICAAKCNSESLGIVSHDEAKIGTIYYAKATKENLTNTNVCLSNSKTLKITSNRFQDDSLKTCADAVTGKFFGKKVTINTESERSTEDADMGTYLSIN
jgi:hypothetical protein